MVFLIHPQRSRSIRFSARRLNLYRSGFWGSVCLWKFLITAAIKQSESLSDKSCLHCGVARVYLDLPCALHQKEVSYPRQLMPIKLAAFHVLVRKFCWPDENFSSWRCGMRNANEKNAFKSFFIRVSRKLPSARGGKHCRSDEKCFLIEAHSMGWCGSGGLGSAKMSNYYS